MFLVYEIISQGGLAGKLRLEVPNLDHKALALLLVLFFQFDKLVAVTSKLLFSVEMQYESTSSPT
jgi:hypothetical protein